MKKLKLIAISSLFVGLILFNFSVFNNTKKDSNSTLNNLIAVASADGEIPPDTYYCWFNFGPGVGLIRLCSACNLMPFASPQPPDGMCWTGSW